MDNNVCNFNTEPLKLDIEIDQVRRGEREKFKHSDSTAGKAWKCAGIQTHTHIQPDNNRHTQTYRQLSILNFTLGKDAEFNSLIHSLGCMMPCLLSWS